MAALIPHPHALHSPLRQARRLCAMVLMLAAAALPAAAPAQDDAASLERRVKAAFLYKFPAFIEWPEGAMAKPDVPLTIGVIGDDAMAGELAQIAANRPAEGRPLVVKKLKSGEPLAGLTMLFIGREDAARLPQIARAAQGQPVLIVSDSDGALQQGSIINFVISGGRVRFEIALEGATARGFRLSSRLLALAQNVRTGGTP